MLIKVKKYLCQYSQYFDFNEDQVKNISAINGNSRRTKSKRSSNPVSVRTCTSWDGCLTFCCWGRGGSFLFVELEIREKGTNT